MIYGGCIESVLDGTEIEAEFDDFYMPKSFSYVRLMPPVRNQGQTYTCVCQTLTGMLDVLENSKNGVAKKCNNFSIQELYNCRADKHANGMSIKEALSYLRHKGLSNVKISNYAKIGSCDAAKKALIMNGPLAAGLPCYENGNPIAFWKKGGQSLGGHCIMLVGYSENGFLIRNSWGASYGKNGYAEISYEEFVKNVFECWTFTL